MTAPADLVREACDLLAGYMGTLELLVAEPATPDGPAGITVRHAETPEPWHAPTGRALMDAHEGVRRLEAVLRYALNGHPGQRRGGSTINTLQALVAIPKLAAGLDEYAEADAVRVLERWINEARSVPAIDEAQRWRAVPQRPCPYCGCSTLNVLEDAAGEPSGRVECFGRTGAGRCRAAWEGLIKLASDLEDAS